MPKQTETPAAPTWLSCNTILDGRFINAGDRLPVERGADLPEVLRPLVVTGEPEPEEPNEAGGFFDLNTPYRVTDDNRLGRRVQRQISEMEAAAQEQEWIEEQMDAPLPPQIAETLQQAHQSHVACKPRKRLPCARGRCRRRRGRGSQRTAPALCEKRLEALRRNSPDKASPGRTRFCKGRRRRL